MQQLRMSQALIITRDSEPVVGKCLIHRTQRQCDIRVVEVYLSQISPGTHLLTNMKGKEEELSELDAERPRPGSNPRPRT